MIESYTFRMPARRQNQCVSRTNNWIGALEIPLVLAEDRFVFGGITVTKYRVCISVILCRNTFHTVFVIDIIRSACYVECFILAIAFDVAVRADKPGIQLFHFAGVRNVTNLSNRIIASFALENPNSIVISFRNPAVLIYCGGAIVNQNNAGYIFIVRAYRDGRGL